MTAPEGTRRWTGSVMVAAAASGWGTWPFFLRQAEKGGAIHPALEATASLLALTALSGALVGRDRLPVRASRRDWSKVALLGVTDALNVAFFFAAYQRTTVAVAVLTHYLTPMLVALAAPLAVGERWRARTFVSVAVSFAGLVLLLAPWSGGEGSRHDGQLVGAAFGVASALCYATNVLVSKSLVPVFSGSEMAFYHGIGSVLILALLVPHSAWSHLTLGPALWLASGALVPGAMCGLLFVWGLRKIHASHASNLTLFEPLVATVAASLVFHEPLALLGFVGGALILAGAGLAVTGGESSTSAVAVVE